MTAPRENTGVRDLARVCGVLAVVISFAAAVVLLSVGQPVTAGLLAVIGIAAIGTLTHRSPRTAGSSAPTEP